VELHDAHGKAPRFGVVLAVAGDALLEDVLTERRQRQSALDVLADVAEAGDRRTVVGGLRRRRLAGRGNGHPHFPETREVGLAVRRARRRCVQIRLARLGSGYARIRMVRPLRPRRRRERGDDHHNTSHTCGQFHPRLSLGMPRDDRLDGGIMLDMRLTPIVLGAACVALLAARPALAHHSFSAEYDRDKPITLTGTVTRLEWTNPHARIYIDVKDEKGEIVNWDFELGPPNGLMRRGWNRNSLRTGHVVTIEGFLSKTNPRGANARSVKLPDGRQVFAGSSFDTGPAGDDKQ
jgi:hypothetical protein